MIRLSRYLPGTSPVTFKQVIADQYSLCAIPINGDLRDVSFTTRLQEQAEQLKVYCQVEVIPESPKEQSIVVVVPPMEPLVDPQSEQPAP